MTLRAHVHELIARPAGNGRVVLVERDGEATVDARLERPALLPGSFNPLHHGHELLAEAASAASGRAAVLEVSVANVDKPPLDVDEVLRRIAQFRGRWDVVLTRAPTFLEKGRLFPGATFVVGWDTAIRLVEPRYYGGPEAMAVALDELEGLGCRFVVGGRLAGEQFRTLADIEMDARWSGMFEAIPEELFRADVSSTALRADAAGNPA
ncbi:MAG: hypothetical protein AB7L91_07020 [Dehalococcoidia bacterium]